MTNKGDAEGMSKDSSPNPEAKQFDFDYKIIIIGDAGAGKSCLFHQFREGKFKKQTMSTIGVEFGSKIITLQNEHRRVKLNVWDTAGQERYRAVTRSYYRGAVGAVILFDITSAESFKHVPGWVQDARDQTDDTIDIMLVGNKCDLADQREVKFMDATRWARNNNLLFLETSAVTGENVQEVFQILAQTIQAKKDKMAETATVERSDVVQLQQPAGPAPQSCCNR
eukprot:TRINITY_DN19956_c0_g1_i1.p1 TRINITY_DN19956_c0_g1~~TRINITY_DN19956_c0_g1_i1.p1  ORF type:complete len:225 (+),score=40.73 TRINITY_DN19956_c0_g1_i1:105-779(+)